MRPAAYLCVALAAAVCVAQDSSLRLQDPAQIPATSEDFFRSAGEGLEAAEARTGPYWRRHLSASRRAIEAAARRVASPRQAVVLGAGECREIPLEALARRFDAVALVDLDTESMQRAVAALPAELRARVEIRERDVTSFAEQLMAGIRRAVERASASDDALRAVGALLEDADLGPPARLPQADLVISSLVLSELHRYPLNYADQLLDRRFGTRLREGAGYATWRARLRELAVRDHVRLLTSLVRPGGVVYWADTTARGPLREKLTPARRDRALGFADRALAALRNERRSDPELRSEFERVLRAVYPAAPQTADELLDAPIETQDHRLADITLRLACRGLFEPDREARALEAWLAGLEPAESFEPLVEPQEVESSLGSLGVEPLERQDWFWIQYPCSAITGGGAFEVRAVTFGKPELN